MNPETWASVAPLLQTALARSSGPERLDDVRDDILTGAAQLWRADGTAVVTETRGGGTLNVWLYAGRLEPMPDLFASACAWGRTMGMDRMTVRRARPGWARVLVPLGFIVSESDGEAVLLVEL